MRNLLSVFTLKSGSPESSVNAPAQFDIAVWRPIRSPFERWPHLTDLLIALLAFALNLLLWSSGDDGLSMSSFLDVGAYLCVFIGSFALLWRRSHPWQVHALILSLSLLLFVAAPVDGIVAMLFSLYSLGRYEADRRASVTGAVCAFAFVVMDLLVFSSPGAGSTFAAVMVLAMWYLGQRLRFRGEYLRLLEERAQYLERERSAESERAVAAERTRIARDMHDIVAHQLSLMTIQAGAARTIAASDPKAAGQSMAAVEAAGRQALSEMRHLLGVLRPAEAQGSLEPQPGLGDLVNLVRQVKTVGLDLELQTLGDLSGLAAGLELVIYRIVQEALTNVIKHVGLNVKVMVSVEGRPREIIVLVKDDGPGCFGDTTGGHGVVGMRERVQLLGGVFSAGNGVNTGFEVRAALPRATRAGEEQLC